ncbi:MAG: hypothetical protein H6Q66_1028 [Firmicutes bacterium]|nr:hypothetical protein [Bacillota bacterium]
MSIRPIDLQVLIPRVAEIGKVQQISDRQMLLQQQQFADHWIHIADLRSSQVQNVHKPEAKKVHVENQNEKSFANSEQHYENDHPAKDEDSDRLVVCNHPSTDDPIRGHIVDIKT